MQGVTVFSFQPEVLTAVTNQLRWQETEREAHVRVFLGDLSHARITPLLNRFVYWRTMQTSLGNLRFLRDLEQQLRVPGKECKRVAEFLFDAELRCPLGGEYVYQPDEFGIPRWTSTSFADGKPLPPMSGIDPTSGEPPSAGPRREVLRERRDTSVQQPLPAVNRVAEFVRSRLGNTLNQRESETPEADQVSGSQKSPSGDSKADSKEPFLAPPLNWFRGLEGNAIITQEAITAHLEILMEHAPSR